MWEVSFSDMSSVLGTLETRSKELKVHVGNSAGKPLVSREVSGT